MRTAGLYWVYLFGNWTIAEWVIVDSVLSWWKLPGLSKKFYDKDLEIGDKIEVPEKYL